MRKNNYCKCSRCGVRTQEFIEVKATKTVYIDAHNIRRNIKEFMLCDKCAEEIKDSFAE